MFAMIQLFAAQLPPVLSAASFYLLAIVNFILGGLVSYCVTDLTVIVLHKLLPHDQEYVAKWGASEEAAYKLKLYMGVLRVYIRQQYLINVAATWLRRDNFGSRTPFNVAVRTSVRGFITLCFASLVLAALWRLFAIHVVEDRQHVGEGVVEGAEIDEDACEHHMDGSDDGESIDDGEVEQKLEIQEEKVTSEADKEWAAAIEFAR